MALAELTVVLIEGAVHQQAPMAEIYRRPATFSVSRLLGGFTEVPGIVRDGVHHSAWGGLPVADGAPRSGAAVALLRREALRLEPLVSTSTRPGVEAQVVSRSGPPNAGSPQACGR